MVHDESLDGLSNFTADEKVVSHSPDSKNCVELWIRSPPAPAPPPQKKRHKAYNP